MSHSFFCFQSLKYVSQPNYSYWCWAACLEQMIKGLKANSKIGTTQCELASTYKDIKEVDLTSRLLIGNINDYKSNKCCNVAGEMPIGCDVSLQTNDLKSIFSFSGFNAEEIENITTLNNFDFIKQTLINNQSPIVIKTIKNGYAHMNLISGFGNLNNCKYLLISDPLESIGETYQNFDGLITPSNIERAWTTKLNIDNLKTDTYIEKSLEIVTNFIIKYKAQIENFTSKKALNDNVLGNPWKYLANNDPLYIAQSIKTFMENDKRDMYYEVTLFFEKLTQDNEMKNLSSCENEINKDLVVYTDINFINESFLKDSMQKGVDRHLADKINKGNALSYIKEYATSIEIKIEDEIIKVKPVRYPKNYKIKDEWTTYSSFISQLSINPKIAYFNEDLRPRPSQQIKLSKY
nr:hypothetical protein [uncultured Psychroserpens sp.]